MCVGRDREKGKRQADRQESDGQADRQADMATTAHGW